MADRRRIFQNLMDSNLRELRKLTRRSNVTVRGNKRMRQTYINAFNECDPQDITIPTSLLYLVSLPQDRILQAGFRIYDDSTGRDIVLQQNNTVNNNVEQTPPQQPTQDNDHVPQEEETNEVPPLHPLHPQQRQQQNVPPPQQRNHQQQQNVLVPPPPPPQQQQQQQQQNVLLVPPPPPPPQQQQQQQQNVPPLPPQQQQQQNVPPPPPQQQQQQIVLLPQQQQQANQQRLLPRDFYGRTYYTWYTDFRIRVTHQKMHQILTFCVDLVNAIIGGNFNRILDSNDWLDQGQQQATAEERYVANNFLRYCRIGLLSTHKDQQDDERRRYGVFRKINNMYFFNHGQYHPYQQTILTAQQRTRITATRPIPPLPPFNNGNWLRTFGVWWGQNFRARNYVHL